MNWIRQAAICALFICFNGIIQAQQTTVYTEANRYYKLGLDYFDKGLFAQAYEAFGTANTLIRPVNEPEWDAFKLDAGLYTARCAVNLNRPDAEKIVANFLRDNAPSPAATNAALEIAEYYYNQKKYEEALRFYTQIGRNDLNAVQRNEVDFRMGYCYFVRKKFSKAQAYFIPAANDKSAEYYYPANYYQAMIYFFNEKYDEASARFKKVETAGRYKPYIPYYVTQVNFAQGNYDEVISYGESRVNTSIKKKADVQQLIGKAYFEKGDYTNALPYLEDASKRLNKMREEDFYQLGYVQYRSGAYGNAAKNFQELSNADNRLGQTAMYYLGDCYIKLDDKPSARNAMAVASRMNDDPIITKEAKFNYAKLSYELGFDTEALTALQDVPNSSTHYAEAQEMMSNIFLHTRDYARALQMLENMPLSNRTLKETYQLVALNRGIQLFNDGKLSPAYSTFSKVQKYSDDQKSLALSYFWQGEIDHLNKGYVASQSKLSKFLSQAGNMGGLPYESGVGMANYIQGYNYLKQNNHVTALNYFQTAVADIKRNAAFITDTDLKQKVLGDAVVRSGDCLFKQNNYNKAIQFYNEAVQNRYPGFVYALYQKAIIEGLRGNPLDKVIAMENLVKQYPSSGFAADALLQTGATYMELNELTKAKAPLQKLVNEYKSSPLVNQANLRLGLISFNQNSPEKAANYYKQVFENNPTSEEAKAALTALEEIYVDEMNRPDLYFAFLDKVPGYNVGDSEKENITFTAAENQYNNGNYARAITGFQNYLRSYPSGAHALQAQYLMSESYAIDKDYSNALKGYVAVVNKGNSHYYAKALSKASIIAYNHEEDFEQAFELFEKWEKVAVTDEDKIEAQQGMLQSAYRINNVNAVKQAARKISTNPKATDAQKSTAFYYSGKLSFDQKSYDEAMKDFNQVVRLSNDEHAAEARYLAAYINYIRRDLEVARTMCNRAVKDSKGYDYWIAKSLILLGDIETELSNYLDAKAALEAVIAFAKDYPELVKDAEAKLKIVKTKEAGNSRIIEESGDELMMDEVEEAN